MLLPHGLLGDITQIITFALYRVATLMDALREIFMTALKQIQESQDPFILMQWIKVFLKFRRAFTQ